MRVIAGEKKGSSLRSLDCYDTRPTSDRIKESMFNIIQWEVKGSLVLDLFAGSGGLGIEALSRGARYAIFVDSNPKAVKIIRANVERLGYNEKSQIICVDFKKFLKNLQAKQVYDIIFLDPPYNSNYIETSLDLIFKYKIVSEDGIIICESDKNKHINDDRFQIKKEAYYGNTKLCILKMGGVNG